MRGLTRTWPAFFVSFRMLPIIVIVQVPTYEDTTLTESDYLTGT